MKSSQQYPYIPPGNPYPPFQANRYPNTMPSVGFIDQEPYVKYTPMMNPINLKHYPGPYSPHFSEAQPGMYIDLGDYGPQPYAVNIHDAALQNTAFRTTIWTGNHLQVTLMSLNIGEDIGLEIHPQVDQFIRIEQGEGLVMMGSRPDYPDYRQIVYNGFAFVIPAGTWHNLINTGSVPLKLYSIYAPPQHPHGTVHATKADAMVAEGEHA